MEILYDPKEGVLTVTLPEKVDANNRDAVQEEIVAAINENKADNKNLYLYLDASNTTYMSSAGIRVIISLSKRTEILSIINTGQSLYEILNLTGVNNIISILPPIEEISLKNCKAIGGGQNSTIYRIDEDKICKVFSSKNTLQDVLSEKQMSLKAVQYGLPTALSYQVITAEGNYGVVYEMLQSSTVSELLKADPGKLDFFVDQYIELLLEINSILTPRLPDAKVYYRRHVIDRLVDHLDTGHWGQLNRLVDSIPDGDGFVHGDLHFANLFETEDGLMIIDMDSAKRGSGIWDIIAIHTTLVGFRILNDNDVVHLGTVDYYGDIFEKILEKWLAKKALDRTPTENVIEAVSYARILDYSVRHEEYSNRIEECKAKLLQILDETKL